MSRGFSRAVLVGNLGRDPEMRYSQSGTPITNLNLAVGRRRKDQDGTMRDETDWYRVTLFRNLAESANEWLKKGSRVLVEGQLQIRTYTGNDGQERTSVDLLADNFMNLTPRDDAGMGGGYQPRERDNAPTPARGPAAPAAGGGARKQPGAPFDDDNDDFDDVPF